MPLSFLNKIKALGYCNVKIIKHPTKKRWFVAVLTWGITDDPHSESTITGMGSNRIVAYQRMGEAIGRALEMHIRACNRKPEVYKPEREGG